MKGKGKGKAKTKAKDVSESDSDDEYFCLVCGEDYSNINSRSGERWITCAICTHWAHQECTPGVGLYICHNCDSDDDI